MNGMGLSAMGALFAFGWAFYQVGSLAHENRANVAATMAAISAATDPKGSGLPTVFNESRDVTIALLKPCKPGNPASCGLIPALQATALGATQAATVASQQIAQTQPLIQAAANAVTDTAGNLNKTIDAATETTLQARDDLKSLDTPISDAGPLLEAYTQSGRDLNAILERPAIGRLLDSSAAVTQNAAGISADGKKITDKLTSDYLSPQPWWKKVGRFASDTYDYGALFARHTP